MRTQVFFALVISLDVLEARLLDDLAVTGTLIAVVIAGLYQRSTLRR